MRYAIPRCLGPSHPNTKVRYTGDDDSPPKTRDSARPALLTAARSRLSGLVDAPPALHAQSRWRATSAGYQAEQERTHHSKGAHHQGKAGISASGWPLSGPSEAHNIREVRVSQVQAARTATHDLRMDTGCGRSSTAQFCHWRHGS